MPFVHSFLSCELTLIPPGVWTPGVLWALTPCARGLRCLIEHHDGITKWKVNNLFRSFWSARSPGSLGSPGQAHTDAMDDSLISYFSGAGYSMLELVSSRYE